MTEKYEYKVGGSLGEDAPSYVNRQADSDLYHSLKAGDFCYIFNSRQMGKTSLIVRTMKKLQAEGFACTSLDFSVRGGRDIKSEQWYAGIVYKLITNFNLGNPAEFLHNWWREISDIPPVQRLEVFIESILLTSIQSKIIIFIDEIDSILSLDFATDDFFALIRSCYEKRNFNPEYQRLTFALVGVATPSDLITDKSRTPFNIGQAIQLDGFKESEIEPLAKGFSDRVENPLALMREVIAWTGGQPFLTQKVCRLLIHNLIPNPSIPFVRGKGEKITGWVEEVVRGQIIKNWEAYDQPEHLKTIRDRMLLEERFAGRFLGWYQDILLDGKISVDASTEQMKFRLTGLVVKQQDKLKVYNKIYESVFHLRWVKKELAKLRPYPVNFQAWVDSGYQDESQLLRGQALQEALRWADGKSLSSEDRRYLTASQELEKRELEEESRVLAQANEALNQTNDALNTAQKKAKRRIRLLNRIFAISLAGAIVAFTLAGIATQRFQEAKIVTELEKSSAQLLRLPVSSFTLDNLIDSMRSAIKLKELVKDSRHFEDYPTISPLLALQITLENIREKNRLSGDIVKFSPDGQTVATASSLDHTAKLWNRKGEAIATLPHQAGVNDVAFSPDSQTVATASRDKTAKLWNRKGEIIATLQHQAVVNDVEFSPDSQTVATVSGQNTAKLWNRNGETIATLPHQYPVTHVEFSPDGQTVATASMDNKLWNRKGEIIATLQHQAVVNDVEFSPDGQTVATTSLVTDTAKLWNRKGEAIATLPHQATVNDVEFSPDDRTVATASSDNTAKLWNYKGEAIATFPHQGKVNYVEFSPDGQAVATASDNTAKLWNRKGKAIANFPHQNEVKYVEFSPDDRTVATVSGQNTTKLWNRKGEAIATLPHQYPVTHVEFSPDGQTVATTVGDNTVKLWNRKGEPIATLSHQSAIFGITFSPNGQTVATASMDNTAKLWNRKGKPIATLQHQAMVSDVAFSPDGQTVATASDNTAKLWNRKGEPIATLQHQAMVSDVEFSPDGQTVATASLVDDIAKLWNRKGEPIATLPHQSVIFDIAFSPDGQTVATTASDNTAKLWNRKGEAIATLPHQNEVKYVEFSPDSQTVATTASDNTAKLWNRKGEAIATFSHQNIVDYVGFSPDGQTVATASIDGTMRLWVQVQGMWQQLAEYRGKHGRLSADGKLIAIVINNTVELHRFDGLDGLLARGCNWLQDYLATRDELRSELCPGKARE
ncbi:hypothetical protein C7B79_31090 [Chroococcidiopsis cubana CCALA 043]|uniref:eIF2A-related protein n=1 Tax=Chroococcidiopsis cubana TaxID=171392 RepID=UPI000D083572|nr:AAA-like domain-containing protein [Chroococcidiopsis cubana]PSB57329.1 hypothetical protein C7B79_31090 [Chroococcidiopsis cubana CCALA 043]